MNTVSLINDTSERIRLAVFKQPTIHLRLDPIALRELKGDVGDVIRLVSLGADQNCHAQPLTRCH